MHGSTFTFDNTALGAGIAFPLDGPFENTAVLNINGDATDNVPVSTIALNVQERDRGRAQLLLHAGGAGFANSCPTSWFKA